MLLLPRTPPGSERNLAGLRCRLAGCDPPVGGPYHRGVTLDEPRELAAALSKGTVAVLSDLHGNAPAFRAAAESIAARRPDAAVVLGDLLTYGCEPLAVLQEVERLAEVLPLFIVKGNHDEFYFATPDLPDTEYFHRLQSFVRESVEWTARLLDDCALAEHFAWHERLSVGPVLFAHANPFASGDWTYLNGVADMRRAATTLADDGRRVGVFGHTHRRRSLIVADEEVTPLGDQIPLADDPQRVVTILNPGSVGQPRGERSSMLYLHGDVDGLKAEFVELDYDVGAHTRAIESADLSEETKSRLLSFFGEGRGR